MLGNYIGTDATGSRAVSNGSSGLTLFNNSHDITIGGTNAGALNLISGNWGDAIYLEGASNIVVQGNYLGTDHSGSAAIANSGSGLQALAGSQAITIGGTNPAARNLISGNLGDGLTLNGLSNSVVQGNYIGTDLSGSLVVSNTGSGIDIFNSAQALLLGGTNVGARQPYRRQWQLMASRPRAPARATSASSATLSAWTSPAPTPCPTAPAWAFSTASRTRSSAARTSPRAITSPATATAASWSAGTSPAR